MKQEQNDATTHAVFKLGSGSSLAQVNMQASFLRAVAAVTATTTGSGFSFFHTYCDDDRYDASTFRRQRRHNTLRKACTNIQRNSTKQVLRNIRQSDRDMISRWEKDEEEHWRKLPARAWPAVQPDEEATRQLAVQAKAIDCHVGAHRDHQSRECQDLLFQIATGLVFYNVSPATGLSQFESLAKQYQHVDSMVACGIILVEGLGVAPREKEGIKWLEKAVKKGSPQACYELGTAYYTGIDGVLEEDSSKAVQLFEQALQFDPNHAAALYMVADCLAEGEGTTVNRARAVKLWYQAAELGHRFARQRIRELLRATEC